VGVKVGLDALKKIKILSPYRNHTRFLSRPALSLVAIPTTLSWLSIPSRPMSKDNKDPNLVRSYSVSTVSL